MLKERGIAPEWAKRTRTEPDRIDDHDDGTRHFIKQIPEFENRWLRVVVNVTGTPEKPVILDYDKDDRVVGVEFLGVSTRATKEELSSLQFQTA